MTTTRVRTAFQSTIRTIPLVEITPLKELNPRVRITAKYKQIATSLRHVGLIEPLVVFQSPDKKFWLLDGTLRYDILRNEELAAEARCLLATDDESYNYNKRVNYLPPIAEHAMILKALANGVTEERIAEALDVDVGAIRKKRDLLDGICKETVELLKDKKVTADGFMYLRKMKPVRQIYAAEMMIASNNYSTRFVRGLLAVTKAEGLVNPDEVVKRLRRTTADHQSVVEQGSDALIEDIKMVQKDYSRDLLSLTVAVAYLGKMLTNVRIERHLQKHHPNVLQAIQEVLGIVQKEKAAGLSSEPVLEHSATPVQPHYPVSGVSVGQSETNGDPGSSDEAKAPAAQPVV